MTERNKATAEAISEFTAGEVVEIRNLIDAMLLGVKLGQKFEREKGEESA